MKPELILAMLSDLYGQLLAAQHRAATAEERVAELESAQQQPHDQGDE